MGMSVGSDDGGVVAEINVTPMVDVLLCLLIIFMVATSATPHEKLPLDLPETTIVQTSGDPKAPLLLAIAPDGTMRLGKTDLPKDYPRLVEQLAAHPKLRADQRVVLRPDATTAYGHVIRAMAAAHEAGIPQVGIASDRL
jgi:biopolymer transport protein ExbD